MKKYKVGTLHYDNWSKRYEFRGSYDESVSQLSSGNRILIEDAEGKKIDGRVEFGFNGKKEYYFCSTDLKILLSELMNGNNYNIKREIDEDEY